MKELPVPVTTPASARQCALELLVQVLDSKRPFDEATARHAGLGALSDRDRNFARLLVLTTLRRLGQVDDLISRMLKEPLQGKSQDVMHALRLGAVQLLWLETPPHAAVHAMVETVAALGHERMKGLVNAVLKRISQEGAAIIKTQDEATLNVPVWLFASWREAYGEKTARSIALARLSEPPLDISVKSEAAQWAEKLGGVLLPTGSVRLTRAGRVDALPGYGDGAWWVQDAAAALPAQLLGNVHGKTVFDLCAAPGGKSAQLAAAGARVIAVDQSKRRLALLDENMKRLRLDVETVESDVLKWKPDVIPDMILLDAPCTATGTLRRHPEVVWHRTREDVSELAHVQQRMLNRAVSWLKPGGKLVYCVCSLQPEEGELQMQRFFAAHADFASAGNVPAWETELPGLYTGKAEIRSHPGFMAERGGMDGFYANCILRLNNP